MSSNWLKWCKGLTRKPEIFQMSAALGMSRYELAARLMDDLWGWIDETVKIDDTSEDVAIDLPNGKAHVDALTGVPGLADAMTACGWMRQRAGSLVFPNFARHNGRTEKQRLADAAKKKRHRQRDICPDPNGSASSLLSGCNEEEKTDARAKLGEAIANAFFGGKVHEPQRSRFVKCLDSLWKMEATADEFERRMRKYPKVLPDCICTPEAIVKHWSACDGRGGVARRPATGLVHPVHPEASPVESPTVPTEKLHSIREEIAKVRNAR